jgi:hypothetical protein
MKKITLSEIDKTLIKAYCKWWGQKGYNRFPREYEISKLIDNMNGEHRDLVENYLNELKLGIDMNTKRFYFTLKSNSPHNQIGSYSVSTYWTDTQKYKKDVKSKYTSKTMRGYKVIAVYTEAEYIKEYGEEEAAKIKHYYLA